MEECPDPDVLAMQLTLIELVSRLLFNYPNSIAKLI
jgi:hypothetical protein